MRTLASMTLALLAALPFCSCSCNCDTPNLDALRDVAPDSTQSFGNAYIPY